MIEAYTYQTKTGAIHHLDITNQLLFLHVQNGPAQPQELSEGSISGMFEFMENKVAELGWIKTSHKK